MKLFKKGYSLLEIVIGTGILVVVLTGSLLAFVQCMLLNDASGNLSKAVNDAQFVLEQLKALSYGDIASYSAPVFNNLPGETVTLVRAIGLTIATITVNIAWNERLGTRNFSLSTYVSK